MGVGVYTLRKVHRYISALKACVKLKKSTLITTIKKQNVIPSVKFLHRLIFFGLCVFSFADLLGTWHPKLDLLGQFKLQICLLLALGLLQLLWQRAWKSLSLGGLVLALNLFQLLPWYLPQQLPQSLTAQLTGGSALAASTLPHPSAPRLSLLLANVYFDNHRVDTLEAQIQTAQPDLVVLQEANQDQLNMMNQFAPQYPYGFKSRHYGLAVWSHYPLADPQFLLLANQELPSLTARLQVGRQDIPFLTTHLSSPVRKPAHYRNHQLQALGNYLQQHPEIQLVLGDFNTSMWSPFYKQLETASGLQNCRKGFGVLPSWPSQLPAWARIPIDQCLVGARMQVTDMHLGTAIGSDHLPLLITLKLPN